METKTTEVSSKTSKTTKKFVTFYLAEEKYAIDIMETQEIIQMMNITPIPNALNFVEGVINLRGTIIPIINLKKRFQLASQEKEDEKKGIVLFRLENNLILGIKIDQLSLANIIPIADVFPPPLLVSGIGREYIRGVARDEEDTIILILDLNHLLSSEEIHELHAITPT